MNRGSKLKITLGFTLRPLPLHLQHFGIAVAALQICPPPALQRHMRILPGYLAT